MQSLVSLPVSFGTSQQNAGRRSAGRDVSRLPQWVLLYVCTPEAQAHDAEVRVACRATEVYQQIGDFTHLQTHECQLWSSQGTKRRKRDGQSSVRSADSFCFWKVDKCFKFQAPLCLERRQFAGQQLQRVSRPTAVVWQQCREMQGTLMMPAPVSEKLFGDCCPTTAWLVQVPANLAFLRLEPETLPRELVLCTPASVAAVLRVTVSVQGPAGHSQGASAWSRDDVLPDAGGAGEPGSDLGGLAERMTGVRLTPMQDIHMIRLNFALQNASDLPVVVNSVACFLAPITGDLDPAKLQRALLSVPGKDKMRMGMLKLDMLHMHWRRACMQDAVKKNLRVARFLSMDASPQGGYEYLAMTEEIMQREQPVRVPESPWDGFDHLVRTLPIMTLARGETRTFVKAQRLKHLDTYRSQVKGWVSDQGTEKGVPDLPLCPTSGPHKHPAAGGLSAEACRLHPAILSLEQFQSSRNAAHHVQCLGRELQGLSAMGSLREGVGCNQQAADEPLFSRGCALSYDVRGNS